MASLPYDPPCIVDARRQISFEPIIAAFPTEPSEALSRAMISIGATEDHAKTAARQIANALADWFFSGGHRASELPTVSEAAVKRELLELAASVAVLARSLASLSDDADVRLSVSLSSASNELGRALVPEAKFNPDPIEIEIPAGSQPRALNFEGTGGPLKVTYKANLVAKLHRMRRDLAELQEPLAQAAAFTPRKRSNHLLKHLFEQCIDAWTRATGEWPTSGHSEERSAHSPIPGAVSTMAQAVLGEIPPEMNDPAFLRALKARKRALRGTRGIFEGFGGTATQSQAGELPRARAPKRGRPSTK